MAENSMSVVKIPLKTEKWQEDLINKRMELARKIYNAMVRYFNNQYNKMCADDDYKSAMSVLKKYYDIKDKKEKAKYKKSAEYKKAQEDLKTIRDKYDFGWTYSEHALYPICRERFLMMYEPHLSGIIHRKSICAPLYSAYNKLLFDNGKKVYLKNYNDANYGLNSLASDGASIIKLTQKEIKKDGKAKYINIKEQGKSCPKPYLTFGIEGKIKTAHIPLIIKKNDFFKKEMLDKEIREIRVVRKEIKGKWRYFAHITVKGTPAIKYDLKSGKEKHKLGKGKVAIYINPPTITIYKNGKYKQLSLADNIKDLEKEKAEIKRFLEESRRATNPDNFDKNGVPKKGIVENGKRRKLKWKFSKNYHRARKKLHELSRQEAVSRELARQNLANEIISMGNEFAINDYSFAKAAMRSKEDKLTKKGTPASKKRQGKTIGHNAPKMLVTLIDNKLKAKGHPGLTVIKLDKVDSSKKDYKKKAVREVYKKAFK